MIVSERVSEYTEPAYRRTSTYVRTYGWIGLDWTGCAREQQQQQPWLEHTRTPPPDYDYGTAKQSKAKCINTNNKRLWELRERDQS